MLIRTPLRNIFEKPYKGVKKQMWSSHSEINVNISIDTVKLF